MRATNLEKLQDYWRSVLKRDNNKPDAAVVLNHLHSRGDGCPLRGVECSVYSVVQDSIGPVIAEDVQSKNVKENRRLTFFTLRWRGCSSASCSSPWRTSPRWPRVPPCWAAAAASSSRQCWSSEPSGRADLPERSHPRQEVCQGLKVILKKILNNIYSLEGSFDFSSTDPVASSYNAS